MAGVLSRDQPALDAAPAAPESGLIVIEPTHGWRALDVRELWAYRELIYFLAWRVVKVRYKQTALGIAWVVLQPLVAMAIFSIVFGRLASLPSDNVPYPLFVFAGLVPWFYFANATSTASGSLVANTNLVSKVYFPRLAVPLAAVLAGLVDLAIGLALELVLLTAFGLPPTPRVLLVPLLVAALALSALAVSIWLSALDVQYRDVRYAIPFLIQLWLFATPVVYPLSVVSDRWQWLFALNPVTGTIETFRWALLGSGEFPAPQLALGVVTTLLLLGSGLLYFRRVERTFADVI